MQKINIIIMSFNNFEDLERSNTNTSNRYKDYPEFESISASIDNQLHHINQTQLVEIRTVLGQLQNDREDTALLERLTRSFSSATESFKKLNGSVKSLNAIINEIEANHEDIEILNFFKQKEGILIKLIKDSLGTFKNLQRKYESLKITVSTSELDGAPSASGPSQDLSPQQQLQQQQVQITYEPINAEELEQQTLLIQEREREIHQIHQDTLEINDIFENLSTIVNEQQFQIDDIENNLFNYGTEVINASSELRKAERYQRRSGGRMLCCLIILLGVVGFIILVAMVF